MGSSARGPREGHGRGRDLGGLRHRNRDRAERFLDPPGDAHDLPAHRARERAVGVRK